MTHCSEDEVVERGGGKEEQQDGEEEGSYEQLVHVVRSRVDPLSQHVPLLASKQPPERGQTVHL